MAVKSVTTLNYNTVNGVKSIPVRNMPPEAWQSLLGDGDDGDPYDLYDKVPWLYRGINTICEAITGLPRNDDELDSADLRVDWSTFLNEIVGDYLLAGAMFCVIEQNKLGRNRELRRFHPRSIEIKTDAEQGLVGFERRIGGNQRIMFERDALGATWIPSRNSEVAIGTPPAKAAMMAANMLANIDRHGAKFFNSGAVNPTLVEIQDWEQYPEAEQERTRSILKRMFAAGVKKAYEVFPIGANVKVHQVGSNMSDLAVPELTDKKREDISTALGIPQSLLFSSAANYATAREDNMHFYEKTIVPLARRIETMLNPYFLNMGINVQIRFNEQEMDLFQKDEASRSDSLLNLINAGIPLITSMEILGYDLTDEQWGVIERVDREPEPMISESDPLPVIATGGSSSDDAAEPDGAIPVRSFQQIETIPDHLDMWKRKSVKAFKKKGDAVVSFDSVIIPPALSSAIEGALGEADTLDDIKVIFDNAIDLSGHDHGGHDATI